MSHFYYIHRDVGGDAEFVKPGITVHPSNVVRGIQRKQSKKFVIDHLYFGRRQDIYILEEAIKHAYKHVSGKVLLEWGNQTELFKINIDKLVKEVNETILELELDIVKLPLKEPYFGTNTSNCTLRLPGEKEDWYFEQKVNELFGRNSERRKTLTAKDIKNLFKK